MKQNRGGKKYREAAKKIDFEKKYPLNEALKLVAEVGFANFDESVDVALNLGVDARQSDQQLRGSVVLPHGSGKSAKIAVFAKGDKAKAAEEAGADFVGAEDLVEKIQGGWLDFDKAIATPDMMAQISKVAKILGPRGLMPNPKVGTVTMDVAKAVSEQKKGKAEFRTEKNGIVHCSIGKRSMGAEKLKDNFGAFLTTIISKKPQTSKGVYLKRISFSTTMGPPVAVNPQEAAREV